MHPKGKRAMGAADAFLFVNEDFSTLFRGTKNADLDRSKQSHVQRQSFSKRRRGRRRGPEPSATSPTPGDDAQPPGSSGGLPALRPQLDARLPLLPFPASNSLWLPAAADNSTSTTIAHTQLFPSLDRSQIPYCGPPVAQFSPSAQPEPYPSPFLEESLADTTLFDANIAAPSRSTLVAPTEAFHKPEDTFFLDPNASAPPDDPFSNIQAALEKWAPPLMRYFTMRMVPEFFYTDLRATSLHNTRHVEHLHEDMRSCMSDPAEMYAFLASSSCHALGREGKLDLPGLAPKDSNRATLLFKSKAFEALSWRLSSGELSHGIVIAIQRMICAALYTSNFSAVEAHYRAALSMIKMIGGLETFNDFQKERLIIHDFFYALNTGFPPRMELSWDPGDLTPEISLELVIYMSEKNKFDIGRRIRTIADHSDVAFHALVAQCIPQLVETQQVLEWLHEGPYRPLEYRWLTQRRLAIIYRLLTVDENTSTSLQELVRFATLYYCILARAVIYSNDVLVDRCVMPELEKWEMNALEDAFGTCHDLLLWVVVMFTIAIATKRARKLPPRDNSPQRPPPQAEGPGLSGIQIANISAFLAELGRRVCQTLQIEDEPALRRVLRTFLFDDDFVDERYLAFARDSLQLAS